MTQRNLRRWLLGLIVSAVGFSASADALVGDIYYSFNAANKTFKIFTKTFQLLT